MKQAKTSSRLLALLLSLTLVIGMLPTTVFAETAWGGTGVLPKLLGVAPAWTK